ncbi:hypothetical protein RI367_008554 [Sorochytrium milnesiophthora]
MAIMRRVLHFTARRVHWQSAGNGRYALSMLGDGERHQSAIVGWSNAANLDTPAAFQENTSFRELLHRVLHQHAHEDPELQALAQHQSWAGFTSPISAWTRIPDPDDIVGSVLIETNEGGDAKLKADSYQAMPAHRLVSGHGLFRLSDFLEKRLLETLRSGE